ncbi:MAG: S8 family serine peptidase, partial [Clostridiaceae bacterium]|nr:S8 family serine peptidase [Clostridiaceae bacterium]
STVPNNSYESMPGTSMASPMAAGVASLIYGAHPEYTASQVKAILMEETDTFTTDGINIIPVVNAALASDYAKTGDIPQVPPGEVIPDPSKTPYPGLPTPRPPGQPSQPDQGNIELPGHTPFKLEAGQGGLAGLVYDQETENPVALFSIYFNGPDGTMVDHEFAYPYPATYDAQQMGEFFSRIPVEQGQEVEITNLVIDAPGYNIYEVPTVTVRGGEVTSLTIYLEPEAEDVIRLPGHTPFFPEDGRGGFSGFACDADTKERISKFRLDYIFNGAAYDFSYEYPPADEYVIARLQGEFIIWATTDSETVIADLVISAEGYESTTVGDVTVRNQEVTDIGVVYLKRTGEVATVTPEPEPTPAPTEPTEPTKDPQPIKADPDSEMINIPGHTPFYPEAGYGGFAGFVYDAVTKKPIPSFRFENLIWLDGEPAGVEYFDWPYPSDMLAQIEGEFIYWLKMYGTTTDTMQAFDIVADGYETYRLSDFIVEDQAVTDLGVIYMTPKGTNQPPSKVSYDPLP